MANCKGCGKVFNDNDPTHEGRIKTAFGWVCHKCATKKNLKKLKEGFDCKAYAKNMYSS